MARNEEKAQSMLNRFLTAKKEDARGPREKRPYLATECHNLHEADKWRYQIIKEIGKKVMDIQNAGLGEHKLRDLNDEINKLMREKGHWERRILELGGPDYSKTGPKVTDSEGNELQNATGKGLGYRYFGAAKNLPGVKELFEKEAPRQVRRTRHQLLQLIDADYYGFRDEEDGILVQVEAEAEAKLRAEALAEWEVQQAAAAQAREGFQEDASLQSKPQFVAYVPLPDQKEIESRILDKKKAELLAKYSSNSLVREQQEAKAFLNVRQ